MENEENAEKPWDFMDALSKIKCEICGAMGIHRCIITKEEQKDNDDE